MLNLLLGRGFNHKNKFIKKFRLWQLFCQKNLLFKHYEIVIFKLFITRLLHIYYKIVIY